jgi:hypothetical protein
MVEEYVSDNSNKMGMKLSNAFRHRLLIFIMLLTILSGCRSMPENNGFLDGYAITPVGVLIEITNGAAYIQNDRSLRLHISSVESQSKQ